MKLSKIESVLSESMKTLCKTKRAIEVLFEKEITVKLMKETRKEFNKGINDLNKLRKELYKINDNNLTIHNYDDSPQTNISGSYSFREKSKLAEKTAIMLSGIFVVEGELLKLKEDNFIICSQTNIRHTKSKFYKSKLASCQKTVDNIKVFLEKNLKKAS